MALTFSETANIKKAVGLINALDDGRFPLLLMRVSQKLHSAGEHAFSEEETHKLQSALNTSPEDLATIIETCEFFLYQAAYHIAKPAVLEAELTKLQLSQVKVDAIVSAWKNTAKEVMDKLRRRTLPAKQLDSVRWSLNLTMGSSSQTKLKSTNAVVELGIKEITNQSHSSKDEKLQIEFSHEELFQFYNQLESIQSQIDSLS